MSVRANIEKLHWDSEFFSFPIARLTDINSADASLLINDSFVDYRLTQAKVAADDYDALSSLQKMGFQLVDGEVDLVIEIAAGAGKKAHRLLFATEADVAQLRELAAGAFSLSRFRSPWFSAQDGQRFYSLWAEKAVLAAFDDCCLLMKDEQGVIKGFVTLRRLNERDVRIGLLGVNPHYRKRGVGEALVNGAVMWCLKQQAQRLRIATQTGNIAALRLYIKCGATIADASYWLYRTT